jgi:hypothetical protein
MTPEQEGAFQNWYKGWAAHTGISPNPDDPEHYYDYRAAYRAGVSPTIDKTDGLYHWPSQFKQLEHPNRFVNGVDTITGLPIGGKGMDWQEGIGQGVQNVGQFVTSPQFPVVAGQAGAAMMGPNQSSWQAQLGNVMANYGKSNIAATEQKAQAAKTAQMNEWLKAILPSIMAGVKTTPDGVAGPSKVNITTDGQTFTAKVDGDMQTKGGNTPAGGQAPLAGQVPTSPQLQPGAQQAPAQAPAGPQLPPGANPRAYPFF